VTASDQGVFWKGRSIKISALYLTGVHVKKHDIKIVTIYPIDDYADNGEPRRCESARRNCLRRASVAFRCKTLQQGQYQPVMAFALATLQRDDVATLQFQPLAALNDFSYPELTLFIPLRSLYH
jgi:hypothetical protein